MAGIPAVLFLFTFHIKSASVVGNSRYTQEQIKEIIMKTKPDSNSIYLYLKYKYFVKPKIPFVEKVDVDMVNRHSVRITVYEKKLAGCVEFMGEYLYFDKDGIVVESSSKMLEDVPLIKGLKFSEIVLNEKLKIQKDKVNRNIKPETLTEESADQGALKAQTEETADQNELEEQKDDIFDVIMNITQMIEKYKLDVDTVSFNENDEVTLKCGDIKVLLGKKDTYDEVLSDLKNILKEAEGIELTELDMRNYKKGTGYVIGKQKKSTD
jgi:cell division protein FtsQ